MTNKKAVLTANLIYILLVVAFVVVMFLFIQAQMSGASTWSDYYAKQIVQVINYAESGQKITLDVQRATEIAAGNEISRFQEMFEFDNVNSQVCVKLSLGVKTCYYYFNNVDIIDPEMVLGRPINLLEFNVKEKAIRSSNE
ncbi:hypothetical protein J4233_01795 [Candidatus Pacearchaeota archaeon]|nr:hypothetical protein [Candidatus Pacearchaeota archaeon]